MAGAAIVAGVLPLVWADPFWLNVLTLSWIFAIAALGLTLLFGYGNQISFGHAAFVGIGAYVSALAARDLGIPVWATLIIATAATWAVGYAIARPILRLHGLALAMATLALGLAFLVIFGELPITGGPNGLAGIEPLSIGPLSLAGREAAYWGTLAIAGLAFLWSVSVARSATGRALRALAATPVGAEAIGVNTAALKSRVFAFSAGLAGLSGALLAHYTTFISSGTFDFGLSVELVIMVVVGGLRSLPGAFVGAVIVTALPAYLGAYQEYAGLIFGVLLVALFVYLPTGLAGFADRISNWIRLRLARAGLHQRVAGGGR